MKFSTKITRVIDQGHVVALVENSLLDNLSNVKMQPNRVQLFSQVTILPSSVKKEGRQLLIGKGSLGRAQSVACAQTCSFRSKAIGGELGGCYVSHELRDKAEKVRKAYLENSASNPMITGGVLRLSVWGDASKLDEDLLSTLYEEYDHVLAYVSDIEKLPRWMRGKVMASCQTKTHVDQALELGFKMYLGTNEALERARELKERVYRCPIKGKEQVLKYGFGCSTCPIACNGKRNVSAHGLR